MYIKSYKELIVWQRGLELSKIVYDLTKSLPKSEQFSLTSQMVRATISIPCNIAEGKKRRTKNDFCHFLRMADGSAAELETLFLIAAYAYQEINWQDATDKLLEIQKMLSVMIGKLEMTVKDVNYA